MQRSQQLKYHTLHMPRAWVIVGLAALSWGLVIAALQAVTGSLSFLLG